MEVINISKKSTSKSKSNSLNLPNELIEIVVIEDRKLINMLFSKTIQSAIERIGNLKNLPVKFSSFQSGKAFVNDLENRGFGKAKIIVFTDNNLENDLLDAEKLFKVKQKGIDITMIVTSEEMEDSAKKEVQIDKNNHVAQKRKTNPTMVSTVVEQMVI